MSIQFPVSFEWDTAKARANRSKQGVGFAEAATVFDDPRSLTQEDRDAIGEQRFVTLGMSNAGQLLVVVYIYRGSRTIRLILAWKANSRERLRNAEGNR